MGDIALVSCILCIYGVHNTATSKDSIDFPIGACTFEVKICKFVVVDSAVCVKDLSHNDVEILHQNIKRQKRSMRI